VKKGVQGTGCVTTMMTTSMIEEPEEILVDAVRGFLNMYIYDPVSYP